jgi:WD40 repeat protein
LLAASGGEKTPTIHLWDPASRRAVGRIDGDGGAISALAFSPDGFVLATGSEDTTALVWDLAALRGNQPGRTH